MDSNTPELITALWDLALASFMLVNHLAIESVYGEFEVWQTGAPH